MSTAAVAVTCPRCKGRCGICGDPAVAVYSGPPRNPAADERYGGVIVERCAAHPMTVAEYPLWTTKPAIRCTYLTPCGAEMHINLHVSKTDVFLDGEVPRECPEGHLFTLVELAYLGVQADRALAEFIDSDARDTFLAEQMVARAEVYHE